MRLPRASGVLLHPTSLPGPFGSGDFGPDARHFVDWLVAAGQRYWQVLPLAGIGAGHSPYMSTSAFAGNVLLVDLAELAQQGWLDAADLAPAPGLDLSAAQAAQAVDFAAMVPFRMERLARAAARFAREGTPPQREAHDAFVQAHASWLDDYALFMALSEANDWRDWCDWAPELVAREPAALADARGRHAERITFWTFCQWAFFRQWAALKAYANERGVEIVGDAPIFIAHHSAEVWANQPLFELGTD
ncbi:MAG: 4-alpha-glucanotransferase, partial [Rubrivivax sp.]|nr:4-alpha-glucanotransferase [Rubrivivax sp.]